MSELKSSASSTLVTTTAGKLEQQQQSVVVKTTTVISSTTSGTVTNETTTVNSTSHTPDSEFFSEFLYILYSVVYLRGNIAYRCKEWQRTPLDRVERKFNTRIRIPHVVCPVSHYVNYET
jgi:hypothetical protein